MKLKIFSLLLFIFIVQSMVFYKGFSLNTINSEAKLLLIDENGEEDIEIKAFIPISYFYLSKKYINSILPNRILLIDYLVSNRVYKPPIILSINFGYENKLLAFN